ncbi:YoaK family protein [Actinomadura sp. 7K534]|uniref:YoaK family protein n=1 Tax=Actinomadura sp. 7K534 TaxID=2530366 RepID=UPI001404EE95|nr:YoaK family protein [Actinomadura sp. 7K534]
MPEAREHGPLPLILAFLTIFTGLVDAFSYMELGNVFVANITGNIIFLGFGLGGGGSVTGSALATLFFCVGAFLGGHLAFAGRVHRGVMLGVAAFLQTVPLATAALIVTWYGPGGTFERHVLIAVLATAMGWQLAIVRRVDVPDIRTVVVTTTITALIADSGQSREQAARRILSVGSLLAGAALGALLDRGISVVAPLWTGAALLPLIAVLSLRAARRADAGRWA